MHFETWYPRLATTEITAGSEAFSDNLDLRSSIWVTSETWERGPKESRRDKKLAGTLWLGIFSDVRIVSKCFKQLLEKNSLLEPHWFAKLVNLQHFQIFSSLFFFFLKIK